eukprot:TRINITY_DN5489_c0_g1_i2.p1 TRINITY_DN5489_c0_g1~~TRINITY_DN5489_c0_g1_i2.p1  ORF type:complete len:356 (-),score=96.19 TRINITY_DN5489_c0_g1_i2:249-1316(-)
MQLDDIHLTCINGDFTVLHKSYIPDRTNEVDYSRGHFLLVEDYDPTKHDIEASMLEKTKHHLERIFKTLSYHLYGSPTLNIREADDLEEWQWIKSKMEEICEKQDILLSQKSMQHRTAELQQLSKSAIAFTFKRHFRQVASQCFSHLVLEDRAILSTPLESSDEAYIISDAVRSNQARWLEFIHRHFFEQDEVGWTKFQSEYREEPYRRNIVGSLREMAHSAAYGQRMKGLTSHILGDILWSFWKTLSFSLSEYRDLTDYEYSLIAQEMSKLKDQILPNWLEKVRISSRTMAREGLLASKWAAEAQLAMELLASKKPDATFKIEKYRATNRVKLGSEKTRDIENMLKGFLQIESR